jgi:hypothetical protein
LTRPFPRIWNISGIFIHRGRAGKMAANIFQLKVEGKPALGFDTGLDSQAFAQAKMAQFITQPGFVVFPDGKVEEWKAAGVIEYPGPPEPMEMKNRPGTAKSPTMVIWGALFSGERLDLFIEDDGRKDEALEAVRSWTGARLALDDQEFFTRPGGALVSPAGSVFFPPEQLVTRCLRTEGDEVWLRGEAYVHPDLTGKEAVSFTAAAMLYRIFSGVRPFSGGDEEVQHQNVREGVFLPLNLAAPGLDGKTAALIDAALEGGKKDSGQSRRPDPVLFRECLESMPGAASHGAAGKTAAFFHPLAEAEQAKIRQEAARFWKKKNTTVQTRRFVIRNTALILGMAAAILFAVLIGRSIAAGRAALPTTTGMDSVQVIRAYYDAFGSLDHQMMEAAVMQKAGKADIDMVTSFFVISRVRQAYEYTASPVIPAQEWRDSGSPSAGAPVFGVSDLAIAKISGDEEGEEMRYRVSYILWIPDSSGEAEDESPADVSGPESSNPAQAAPPLPYSHTDELTLIRHKGNWRITEINRK